MLPEILWAQNAPTPELEDELGRPDVGNAEKALIRAELAYRAAIAVAHDAYVAAGRPPRLHGSPPAAVGLAYNEAIHAATGAYLAARRAYENRRCAGSGLGADPDETVGRRTRCLGCGRWVPVTPGGNIRAHKG